MRHQSVYCSLRRYLLTNFVTVVLNLVSEHMAGCLLPENSSPALGPSGLACPRPLIFEPPS